jgi:hypothetical protein
MFFRTPAPFSRIVVFGLVALALGACSSSPAVNPTLGRSDSSPQFTRSAGNAATQFLYVYNVGIPGSIPGEYARYSIPDLTLQEMSEADGVGSRVAFGSGGQPFFVDEGTSAFAVYLMPIAKGSVGAKQQFYGIPCRAYSLSTGPAGDFYVDQYCSANALEYTPSKDTHNPKKPLAQFAGGNLGKSGITDATDAVVDGKGNLYVGDNRGGVTYFAAGSKKGVVAFKTGYGGFVNQMVVDKKGDVWSVHGPDSAAVYFKNKISCVIDKRGKVVRNEFGERFANGKLVQHLYTTTTDSQLFSDNGESIAVDSKGRVYTGNQNNGIPGVVLDFDPGDPCPNDHLSFALVDGANPQLAVDASGTYYVTDYQDNTIAAYAAGTTKLLTKITQPKGVIGITYTAVTPIK